jgi:hypothetical protein
VDRKEWHMSLFKGLFGKKYPSPIHALVAEEICLVVCEVFATHGIDAKQIEKETKKDTMEWFGIRFRKYGESGSRYGVPELIGNPAGKNPNWPSWIKLIQTAELETIGSELWGMAQDKKPRGGHMMDEENKRKAACEFAGQLLSKLCKVEKGFRS